MYVCTMYVCMYVCMIAGTDSVVEVSGYFCCACSELWQDREQALTEHCATKKHHQKYEVCSSKLTFVIQIPW